MNRPQRRRRHRDGDKGTRGQGDKETRGQGGGDKERRKLSYSSLFLLVSPSLWPGQKNQAGSSSKKLAFPAFPVGECCSAYSSSATLKLICGTRHCPLINRSVWSFSTPAASVVSSDSRSSLYFPFAKSSR